MGDVYRARDTRSTATSRRFEREARAVAALNHPHICQNYDVDPTYLVREYVDGARIAGAMSVDTAARVALQITRRSRRAPKIAGRGPPPPHLNCCSEVSRRAPYNSRTMTTPFAGYSE